MSASISFFQTVLHNLNLAVIKKMQTQIHPKNLKNTPSRRAIQVNPGHEGWERKQTTAAMKSGKALLGSEPTLQPASQQTDTWTLPTISYRRQRESGGLRVEREQASNADAPELAGLKLLTLPTNKEM